MCELSIWSDPMTGFLWCARINIVLGIIALWAQNRQISGIVWCFEGFGWLAQAVFFLKAYGLTSLSGIAPNFTFAGVVLCVWQLAALKKDCSRGRYRPGMSGFFLALMAACSMVPEGFAHDTFMMSYLYAKLFFLSRPVSLGLTLFALAGCPDCFLPGPAGTANGTREQFIAESRQTAMLATLFFLGGEIAGCYWGFVGWGTTWRWSGNFYYSAMVFVLFMVALHVPRQVFSTAKAYARGMFIPLGIIAAAMGLAKVVQI